MTRTELRTAPTGLPVTSLLVMLDGSAFAERAMHGPHGDADAYVAAPADVWSGAVRVTGRAIYDPVDVAGALADAFTADRPDPVVMGTRAHAGPRRSRLTQPITHSLKGANHGNERYGRTAADRTGRVTLGREVAGAFR